MACRVQKAHASWKRPFWGQENNATRKTWDFALWKTELFASGSASPH